MSGLDEKTFGLILRFTLTDLNVRRLYHSILVKQGTINEGVDISSMYNVYTTNLPSFGLSSELILPWDMKDE